MSHEGNKQKQDFEAKTQTPLGITLQLSKNLCINIIIWPCDIAWFKWRIEMVNAWIIGNTC